MPRTGLALALADSTPCQIDRKNIYREQSRALFFPHFEKPRGKPEDRIVQEIGSRWKALHETVLDGELVWDTLKDGRVSGSVPLERRLCMTDRRHVSAAQAAAAPLRCARHRRPEYGLAHAREALRREWLRHRLRSAQR